MNSLQDKLKLTNIELYFLSGLLGSENLLGVSDPFQGYLTEEVQQIWKKAKSELLGKGILIEHSMGLRIEPTAAKLVAACGLSQRALWVTSSSHESGEYEEYFHFIKGLIVEKIQRREGDAVLYELTVKENIEEVIGDIMSLLKSPSQEQLETAEIKMPRATFQRAWLMAKDMQSVDLIQYFMDAEGSIEGLQLLVNTMQNYHSEGQIIAMSWNDGIWAMQDIGFITGANQVWRITGNQEDQVIFTLCEKSVFQEGLMELVQATNY